MARRQGTLAVLAILGRFATASSAAGEPPGVLLPVDEADELILEVRAEHYLASNGLIGYRSGDRVLLPVGELAAVLEYAVVSDAERGVADGWLVDEDRTFRLDVAARSVTVADRQEGIRDPCLYVNGEDIFVASDVLARWWPIDLEIDLRGLRVEIRAREEVPLISRLNRESRWSRLGAADREDVQYPRRDAPYRLATWPFLDATVAFDADRRGPQWQGSLLSRGDLARLSVSAFVGYDDDATHDWTAWLRAGRSDRDGDLLGPLQATQFTAGDVTGDALPLVGGAVRGRGLTLTNRPLGSVSQFDVVDVTGDAPPGWEAELYLDGSLQAIQVAGPDGHYFFAAVPLHVGLNTIRVVLYGPNGQTREQVRSYNIRSGMWQRGRLHYDYASLQAGESILGAPAIGANVEGEGSWHHQIDLGYGLSHSLTLGASYAQAFVEDRTHDYAQLRLLHSLGPLFLQAVGVKDLDEGSAASLSAQTQIGRHSLFLAYSDFQDFLSNTTEGRGDLVRRTEARFTGAVEPWGEPPLHYRLKWQGEDYVEDLDLRRDYVSLYVGSSVDRVSLGHDARYVVDGGALARHDYLGQFLLAGYLRDVRLRAEVEYGADGDQTVRSVGVTANSSFRDNLTGQFTGRRSYLGEGSTHLLGNLDWHLRPVRLGLRAGWDTADGASVGVSATTSLVRSPDDGGWVVSGRHLTAQGAALATAFIDRDHDGAFGRADEPLAGVGFGRNDAWRDIRTDEDGQAFLPGIQPNQFVNVEVDATTVEDPYLVPSCGGLVTVVHPGGVADLSFPFQYVGEIEGVVARDPALAHPLRNIGLELTDLEGRRLDTAVSEFDGFYLFQNVLPGDYLIAVVGSTLRGRSYAVPEPQPVSVPPGGDYVRGPAIILRSAGDAPPVVAVAPVAAREPVEAADPVVAREPVVPPAREPVVAGGVDVVRRSIPPATRSTPGLTPRPATQPPATQPTATQPTASAPRPTAPSATHPARPAPDEVRTLHLIYELLFDSALFADFDR
ncbi:MAG TPA: hypothetical protein PLL30_08535 [Candidatus Krumholzibacteria bacterium]|nr:hypothetical protein [Candidatus Krumholzibacteria bacterium]HPD71805.1 hypothetical protein [Candidatus Krumholzibacteria bacterium]HRY41262.1 hypothetical protein [Candidatus Krumholzibacteria bacterium]